MLVGWWVSAPWSPWPSVRLGLYVLMLQGGPDTHKDPAQEVWVYDLASHARVQRIHLQAPASSIMVSRDDKPLLYTAFLAAAEIGVYDARTGKFLRKIQEVATTPTLLVGP